MKKLKLNLDEIKVESFETSVTKSKTNGTVFGHVSGEPCEETGVYFDTCGQGTATCIHWGTCYTATCVDGNCPSYELGPSYCCLP